MSRNTIAWMTAAAIAIVGCAVVIVGLLTPVAFGWFAYQPLANATFAPGGSGVFLSRVTIVGIGILALGVVALAFLAGMRVGAKRRA